jgi:hypothetical protein
VAALPCARSILRQCEPDRIALRVCEELPFPEQRRDDVGMNTELLADLFSRRAAGLKFNGCAAAI